MLINFKEKKHEYGTLFIHYKINLAQIILPLDLYSFQ